MENWFSIGWGMDQIKKVHIPDPFATIFGRVIHGVTQLNGNIFLSPQHIWLKSSGNARLAIKVSRVLVLKTGNFRGKISL